MRPSLLVHGFAALCTVGCAGAADIPNTPDLRELLARYDAPTAALDQTSAAEALRSSPSLEELQRLSSGFQAAHAVMETDINQASSAPSGSTGSRIRLQGSIQLKVRCPGDLRDPKYDEQVNGSISLTLAVADTQIRRSFGGEAKACVLHGTLLGNDARIVLDGPLAFDVGNNIGIGTRWSGEFLAQMPGTLTVLDHEFRGISGRLVDGRFQYLVTLGDESTVVIELGDGDGLTLRDQGGAWFCREGEPCAKM